MLDIKLIREKSAEVKKNSKNRGYDVRAIVNVLRLDQEWRAHKVRADKLRGERNKISKEINEAKKANKDVGDLIKKAKEIPKKLEAISEQERELKKKMDNLLAIIPNIQADDVPVGDESHNKEMKTWGVKAKGAWIKPHWEIGEKLGILDLEAASKIAGTGFYVLRGDGAKLQRALVQFMLDFHNSLGREEINPPQIVNEQTLFGTGNLPKFEDDVYKTREGFYLIPTAEVPVTNLYAGEVLKEKDLPKEFCSFTQCYRTEAGRHGTETRGIFRLHEFEKVEMVCICKQEDSWDYLEKMTKDAEKILEKLKIPYRRLLLSTEDAGFASAKTYDLEVWSPVLKKYLEVSSCSNCTDFQARRMNTRYQSKDGMRFVHTLNGSGLGLPRLLISILENYQQKDGSVKVPTVLQKYMGGLKVIK